MDRHAARRPRRSRSAARFTEDRNVSFLYQLSHHQGPRALTHGVRIDAVAGAVAHFQRAMLMDVDQAVGMIR
jgi:hypothetical protein